MTRIIAVVVILLGLLLLVGVVRGCSDNGAREVEVDRAEVSRDAYEKGLAAERAAIANQTAAEAAFRNEQEKADDKIDDAARRRVSPLDELFSGMR